jgi:hypothetical protein
MIGQYLPNNNETATVAFRQKFCQLNSPLGLFGAISSNTIPVRSLVPFLSIPVRMETKETDYAIQTVLLQ